MELTTMERQWKEWESWYQAYRDEIITGRLIFNLPMHMHRAMGEPGFFIIKCDEHWYLGHASATGAVSKVHASDEIVAAMKKRAEENAKAYPDISSMKT